MSEQSVFTSRAVVYVVDPNTRGWVASAVTGFTRLDIYVHSGTGAARVIGRSQEDPNKIVINSNITKDIVYTKARDTFHQWSDARGAFGLNFSSAAEADGFAAAFTGAQQGGAKPAPPSAPAPSAPAPSAPKPAAPPSAPAKPQPPAAPSAGPPAPPGKAPPPPAPPKAPPKPPAAPAGGGDAPPASSERNALLNSIAGFSKGGLKKTVTVDKSSPLLSNKPAAPAGVPPAGGNSLTRKEAAGIAGGAAAPAPSGGGGGGAFGGNDMMAEILRKRNAMQNKTAAEPAAPKPAAAKPAVPTPAATAKPITPTAKQPPPPPVGAKPTTPSSAPITTAPSFGSSSSASELPEHLQLLKEQILAEVRAELAQLKADLLQSLQH